MTAFKCSPQPYHVATKSLDKVAKVAPLARHKDVRRLAVAATTLPLSTDVASATDRPIGMIIQYFL
jgi:hypothetical protein